MADITETVKNGDKRWPGGLDLTTTTPSQDEVTEYIEYRCASYAYFDLQDEDLWDQYKDDFAGVTTEVLNLANIPYLKRLRSILRHCGVWVDPEKNKEPTIRHLIICANLAEVPVWTSQQIANYI
jgi:hypothetical protein